jgi:hypothetical protein
MKNEYIVLSVYFLQNLHKRRLYGRVKKISIHMSNQDILSPVSLQLFPQIPEVPLQISEILNGEKIIASFEVPNTIKYISILNLCVVIMIF